MCCLALFAGEHVDRLPSHERLEAVTGLPATALGQAEQTVRQLLGNDTAGEGAAALCFAALLKHPLFVESLAATDDGHTCAALSTFSSHSPTPPPSLTPSPLQPSPASAC